MVCSKRSWSQTRDVIYLERAIRYARDALPLYSTGSIDHSKSQEYLGTLLHDQFLQSRQRSDLEESIRLQEAAVAQCPESSYDHGMFLANLGTALSELFDISDDRTDLDAAIAHYSKANQTISTTHPSRPTLESGLALAYLKIIPMSETLIPVAFSLLESASNNPSANSHTQFNAALRWVLAARAHKHPSMIDAFSRMLALLELRLLTKETVEAQQEFLRGIPFRLLASEAAASAIENGRLDTAVELLEQGRTMLWSRMRGYRHPIDDLRAVNASLADQFRTASAELEHTALALRQRLAISPSVDSPSQVSNIQIDNRLRDYRILSENWTRILNNIREVDGFADFLRTPSFSTLRTVASEGPVILVNVAQGRCDAISIHQDSSPHLVPLPESTTALFDHLATQLWDSSTSEHAHRVKRLTVVLRELWRAVVHPVVEVLLSLKVESRSRIWWCPTAQLCALPVHAAGPYTPGQRNLPDLFVSSYTPTLNALMTARAGVLPAPNSLPRLLIIGQPQTLPMVEPEIEGIRAIDNFADVLLGAQATSDAVLSELRTHSWIHFACHGSRRHAEPFKSAFELYDGNQVTVLDIARANLPCAEFAFLSACHTAAPDVGTPDEFITLAAALQFAGFRGVVSTFWDMADEDGPKTSGDFYSYMLRRSTVADSRDAAMALNLAVRSMRKRDVPLYRWVNFIHIGI